ncbi:EAL domain-containing protein [Sulfoacidibacillus thermotolerans]|uniref:EAL domain-containing protein n=1 Tax=Sulfoacidibacillus thermotolerans TaxID=1765684 RepID=A0A2U3DB98_SULT2|nr:EAL domain-containing protein [Sulfoacidibacillus thermotolerans]PWI58532.1 hypothetical protein BM613_03175 [Sulfoacidibacillus thermotolerans]
MNQLSPHLETAWKEFRENGQLQIVFQPILRLESGQIIGYELLSRASSGSGQPMAIDELLTAAEALEQLSEFDLFLLDRALDHIGRLPLAKMRFFVNVIPSTLQSNKLAKVLHNFVERTRGTIPLVLEVCERTADPSAAPWSELLEPIRRMGIDVAIDDVGSGYAGLNRTVEIQPNWMKLDIGLVRDIDTNSMKAAMVASIVTFARKLGSIHLIAEGIETQAEFNTLRDLGIEYGQGYWLARPLDRMLEDQILPLGKGPKRPTSAVSFDRYGVALAGFLERICNGHVAETAMALDACNTIEHVIHARKIEVFRVVNQLAYSMTSEADVLDSEPYPVPDEAFGVLRKGQEHVAQKTQDLSQEYSLLHGCLSSVKVPILVQEQLLGFLYCGFSKANQVRANVIVVLKGFATAIAIGIMAQRMIEQGLQSQLLSPLPQSELE